MIGVACMALRWYLPVLLSRFIIEEQKRNRVSGWLTLVIFIVAAGVFALKDYWNQGKKAVRGYDARSKADGRAGGAEFRAGAFDEAGVDPMLSGVFRVPVYGLARRTADGSGRNADQRRAFTSRRAARCHARSDLIVIGITGSFGKTQTKFILRELLSKRYRVLATPASFNTAMGISRVVNDSLKKEHQVFIAEMGAQKIGDIENLVRLTKPKYGLITSIGQQHIDTFGSFANILDAKYELIEGLPEDGVAFFAMDNGYAERLFAKCPREKYAAAVDGDADYYMRATDVKIDTKGMHFTLRCSDGGFVRCHTRLLGRFNAQNIALASATAHRMGLSMEEIAAGIARLRAVRAQAPADSRRAYRD